MSNREYHPGGRPPQAPRSGDDLGTDDDVLLQQVRAALAPMPSVDRRAIADILAAVAERKQTPFQRFRTRVTYTLDQFRYATSPLARATAIATLFVVVGYTSRSYLVRDAATPSTTATPMVANGEARVVDSTPTPTVSLQAVEGVADPTGRLVSVQFVLDAREVSGAASVSVVGDFNNWDVRATPMTLDRGAWSVSLPTTQGRHVYAFVVDGERWIADPRAPKATDSDFGRPGSVIIVQTP
jgi:Glycogen recognition site of AMP-activated protein kinase